MERELWKTLYCLAKLLDKSWGRWRYRDADVLAIYFWAVVKDRPVSWAVKSENWLPDLLPAWFPPQCTVSRRMRKASVVRLLTAVEEHLLGLLLLGRYWVRTIDAKPLAVSHVSKDPDAAWGRFARRWLKGYKLHAVWGQGPMPMAWALTGENVSEKRMARHLIADLPGEGYLLGDSQFDVGDL